MINLWLMVKEYLIQKKKKVIYIYNFDVHRDIYDSGKVRVEIGFFLKWKI